MSTTLTAPAETAAATQIGPFGQAVQIRLPHLVRSAAATTAAAPSAVPVIEGPTLGWDAVFAIRIPDVNAAIVKKNTSPASFSLTVDQQNNYTIGGSFGPWQMTMGGSGAKVYFSIPITSGSMTFQQTSLQLAGAAATVEVNLKFIPQASSGNNTTHNLQVNPDAGGDMEPAASVVRLKFPAQVSDANAALASAALNTWFNQNLSSFTHVFAAVDLSAKADKDQFQWLMPTFTSYAYFDGTTPEDSFLGVLTLTENHDNDGLSHELAPGAIPRGSRSGFSISMDNFLRKFLLPSCPSGFKDSSASDFVLDQDDNEIVSNKELTIDSVSVGGISYHPKVQKFSMKISGNEIRVYTLTHINISPGIDTYVETTTYNTLALNTKQDGSQVLTFQDARDTDTKHWVDVSPGITITTIVLAVIGAIAGGLTGLIENTVKNVIAACVIGVVAGLIAVTPQLVAEFRANDVGDKIPAIDPLVQVATNAIRWSDSGDFQLTGVQLNESLQLLGDPRFAI